MNDLEANGASIARSAWVLLVIALLMSPMNFAVWFQGIDRGDRRDIWLVLFTAFTAAQVGLAIAAIVQGIRSYRIRGKGGIVATVLGVLVMLAAPAAWVFGMLLAIMSAGGAWGRPLRVRGRQLHPALRKGSDWTRGAKPNPAGLDEPTRRALQALWLHDAQKEHASVPAFSRISWLLAAVGAPADLMEWSHRAALEEIDHTRLCFALAAGYGEQSHSVRPMPELLAGLDLGKDPLLTLAAESLSDGCQLEDFNADVAAACALLCQEPVTRRVLEQVAKEERSHAEFSWAVLAWALELDRKRVQPMLEKGLTQLQKYRRPTAVSWDKQALVAKADSEALRRHGRLRDEEWRAIWDDRLVKTGERLQQLLQATRCAA